MPKRVSVKDEEVVTAARAEWESIRDRGSWADREAFLTREQARLVLTITQRSSIAKDLKQRKRHLREICCSSTSFEQAWFGKPRIEYAPNQRCACENCNRNGRHILWPDDRIVLDGISRECHFERQEVDPELAEDIEALNASPQRIGSVIDARGNRFGTRLSNV